MIVAFESGISEGRRRILIFANSVLPIRRNMMPSVTQGLFGINGLCCRNHGYGNLMLPLVETRCSTAHRSNHPADVTVVTLSTKWDVPADSRVGPSHRGGIQPD
jgi:hypothetical protein